MVENMNDLAAAEFNQCEQQCYNILVRIEKEIGWEKLLKMRTGMFLMEQDSSGLSGFDEMDEEVDAFGSDDESMIIISK